jgi:hypothetical protein
LVLVVGRDPRHAVSVGFTLGMFGPDETPYRFVDRLDLRCGKFAQRIVQLIAQIFLALFDPASAQWVAVADFVEQIGAVFVSTACSGLGTTLLPPKAYSQRKGTKVAGSGSDNCQPPNRLYLNCRGPVNFRCFSNK